MKKLLSLFLIISILYFLCGCSAKEAIASDKQEYIVSSLGFDNSDGRIKMLIEAIVVNTDDLSEEKTSKIISGEGSNVNEAFAAIISQITQPLSLGHNAVTVIGRKINFLQLEEIFEFLRDNKQINIATMLVATDNAEKLLSCDAVSSVAVGFDVMSMIEVTEEKKGTVFKNRFYEAEALNTKPMKTIYMPYVSEKNGKFLLTGLAVYSDNNFLKILKNEEIPLFCIATDSMARGEIVLEGKKIEIKYSKVTYSFSFADEKLYIELNVRLKSRGSIETLKKQTKTILEQDDIFGIGNILSRKNPEIFDKIKKDYAYYYKNADIRVNLHE